MSSTILDVRQLDFVWHTFDPFLFCVHHLDSYPAGDGRMAPDAPLIGRNIGQDFTLKDGWRMYHGDVVPGFPSHPHRGFETITLARQGCVDHSDSLGATARLGQGDVQWMTAGRGIVHSEMFPLVHPDRPNPTELFQIWLNLPRADKMVKPHFKMMWSETIPRRTFADPQGNTVHITVVAGSIDGSHAPQPPPSSWAARPESQLAIWTIALSPGARWTLPAAAPGLSRMLYLFEGQSVRVNGQKFAPSVGIKALSEAPVSLQNGPEPAELLLLQARPIGEPVVHHGPFVMNTEAEIELAYQDYRRTRFGGWPWPSSGPVHHRDAGRFAIHADGEEERIG